MAMAPLAESDLQYLFLWSTAFIYWAMNSWQVGILLGSVLSQKLIHSWPG